MIRKDVIIEYLLGSDTPRSSSAINLFLAKTDESASLVTVKRELSKLESLGLVESVGIGRATAYRVTSHGRLLAEIDLTAYGATEPDRRKGFRSFNFDLFKSLTFDPFSEDEKRALDEATDVYRRRIEGQTSGIHEKELERFVIELSWKSSKIEGNTYTLLDTERLLKEGISALGHSRDETTMILNHKEAFKYVYANREKFKVLTRAKIEEVHSLIVHELGVPTGLRAKPVGVIGSVYTPLDNRFQISEALDELCQAVSRLPHGYAQALVALLGLSYVQPFEDGNKRTARLIGNALLLAHGYAPLSYRSVDEDAYRTALLVFYELNSLAPFKRIFIEQYGFAARNYLV